MPEPYHLYNTALATNVSMATSSISAAQELSGTASFTVQAIWNAGATPVGSVYLAGSNDGVTYTQIISSIVVVALNSASALMSDRPSYAYVRVHYDRTSGFGNLNITINGKSI